MYSITCHSLYTKKPVRTMFSLNYHAAYVTAYDAVHYDGYDTAVIRDEDGNIVRIVSKD